MSRKRILLLSPYDALSHRYWRHGMEENLPEYEWHTISLPPRHFPWRIRGNPVSLSGMLASALAEYKPDILLCTSATDLATIRGLFPELSRIPNILYMHENQFVFPESRHSNGLLEAKMVQIYAALAADKVLFNSQWNRISFLEGADRLLAGMPEKTPFNFSERIAQKADILPVPLASDVCQSAPGQTSVSDINLLWNHRWEHDKNPEMLLLVARALEQTTLDWSLNVCGETFRQIPPAMQQLKAEFQHRIRHWGYLEKRSDYLALLIKCNFVLSTALQEFQGIAVIEAAASDCIPVLPERLSYPEYFPREFLYPSSPENPEMEARACVETIRQLSQQAPKQTLRQDLQWNTLGKQYLKALNPG